MNPIDRPGPRRGTRPEILPQVRAAVLPFSGAFDRTAGRRPPYRWLVREVWSIMAYRPAPPDPSQVPQGDGHVVLIVPPFLSSDLGTPSLPRFLRACGYRAFGWGSGVNWGPTPQLLRASRLRVRELRDLQGGPISLIGVSLGGLLVRDVAHDCAQDIRHVITVVSPFRLPTASTIEPLVHIFAPLYSREIDLARVAAPLPIPSTAIFTRDDGIVAWESCRTEEPQGVSIEVRGPHITICRNPDVLRTVAERLAPLA